ncbi:MAG: hypothetical protein SFW09_13290 [Hyphomicrobiaceae bacterium]|nr:hypothetical protein [Hyphomicrobiaceae bacterium]
MSLRVIPLIVIAFIIYNVVVLFGGGDATAEAILSKHVFSLPMPSGASWVFTIGDLIILVTMILLFIELIKSTYTSSTQMVDHGLSMLVFIACLIEFLLVKKATSSVFFFILTAALVDVVAGALIGIRTARRDLNIGGHE